jgi:hypothetical protein
MARREASSRQVAGDGGRQGRQQTADGRQGRPGRQSGALWKQSRPPADMAKATARRRRAGRRACRRGSTMEPERRAVELLGRARRSCRASYCYCYCYEVCHMPESGRKVLEPTRAELCPPLPTAAHPLRYHACYPGLRRSPLLCCCCYLPSCACVSAPRSHGRVA